MTKTVNKRPPQESEQKQAQFSLSDYRLPQVEVRLYLKEGAPLYGREPVNTAEKAVDLVREFMRDLPSEQLVSIQCDSKLVPINYSVITIGTTDCSMAPMRNLFLPSLLNNSTNIIILHNHPSGDPTPSREDLTVTRRAIAAGRLLGVAVNDHIIVGAGRGDYYSFHDHESGLFRENVLDEIFAGGQRGSLHEQEYQYDAAKAAVTQEKQPAHSLVQELRERTKIKGTSHKPIGKKHERKEAGFHDDQLRS